MAKNMLKSAASLFVTLLVVSGLKYSVQKYVRLDHQVKFLSKDSEVNVFQCKDFHI